MQKKTYTTPLGITSQFHFCGLPLRLDSYAGCAFRCSYCFARFRGGNTFSEVIRPADPEKIRSVFRLALDSNNQRISLATQFLRHRVPIHFGGMSDPFQPAETHYHVTESILRILAAYDYPTVISTKSDLLVSEPYLSLLRELKYLVVQFSFSSTRDHIAKRVEPFSTSPRKLLKTMEELAHYGINVTCRWQPYIPDTSEAPSEFIPRVAASGCKHIALEHLKLPVEQNHSLWSTLTQGSGRNLHEEYRLLGAHLDGREFILPADVKLPTILETAHVARNQGLTFGAADNEFQYLSDTACCCSGVDQFEGFENWFKHQIGYAIRKCKGKKITYESISREWRPTGSIDRYLNSNSRLSQNHDLSGTVREHILKRWNDQNAPGNPASFYGIEGSHEKTADGLKVYQWSNLMDRFYTM